MSDTTETEKRGPGRPRNDDNTTFTLTWIPRDDGDPGKMQMWGMEFRAHVPMTLPKTKCIWAPIRRETMLADGTIAAKSPEQKVAIFDLAKNHPAFSVNGEPPYQQVAIKIRYDADWYCRHALSWFGREHTIENFNAHWEAEAPLREECGVEERDLDSIMGVMETYRMRLAVA